MAQIMANMIHTRPLTPQVAPLLEAATVGAAAGAPPEEELIYLYRRVEESSI